MATCKVGQTIHRVLADHYDTGKVESDIYVVRSIRKGVVFATMKLDGVTWVITERIKFGENRSMKRGWATSIDPCFRSSWDQGGELPSGFGTTKGAAIRSEIKAVRSYIARLDAGDEEELGIANRALKTLERMNAKSKKEGK